MIPDSLLPLGYGTVPTSDVEKAKREYDPPRSYYEDAGHSHTHNVETGASLLASHTLRVHNVQRYGRA